MNAIDYKKYLEAIKVMVNSGYNIIQLEMFPEVTIFFVCHRFEESHTNSADSMEFCDMAGVDITDLLDKNVSNPNQGFIKKLETHLLESSVIKLRFSKHTKWYKFY